MARNPASGSAMTARRIRSTRSRRSASSSALSGCSTASGRISSAAVFAAMSWPRRSGDDRRCGRLFSGGGAARMMARASSVASGRGIRRGVALRGVVSVGPMRSPSGRRERAGPAP